MEIIKTFVDIKKLIIPDLQLWVSVSGTKRLFYTKISGVYESSFTVYTPIDNGEQLIVTKNTELHFMFIMDSGKYFFTTKPIGIIKDDITLLAIELPTILKRHEMRSFYRVEMLRYIPVKMVNVAGNRDSILYKKNDIVTMTCTDLSGGGMKLISPLFLEVDDIIEMDLSGLVEKLNNVRAKVVRYINLSEEGHVVGVMFTSLMESDRDKIIRCVFQRQIKKKH